MTFVAINVISVPPAAREYLEARFGTRKGAVDSSPGFQRFELLRPVDGTDDYYVYTRWDSEEDFQAWRESDQFGRGHSGPPSSGAEAGPGPSAAPAAALRTFTVVQESDTSAAT